MKKFLLFFGVLSCLLGSKSYSQIGTIIPANRRVDWSGVGYPGGIPNKYSIVLNIKTDYIDKYSLSATDALSRALADAKNYPGLKAIYFPQGSYDLDSPIVFTADNNNTVIRGDGAGLTYLNIHTSGDLVTFSGTALNTTGISSYNASTKTVTLSGANADINTGDFVEILISNSPNFNTFGDQIADYVGQIVKVTNKLSSTSFQLADDISLTWNANSPDAPVNPRICKIVPVQKAGMEALYVIPDYGNINNFTFSYAANCWLKGVHSWRPGKYHIMISKSTGIEIRGCYIEQAQNYGDGGYGYGVDIEYHSTNCLIEDNVFNHLRHAMVVQNGANRNVFGYNYAINRYQCNSLGCSSTTSADICVHGHYPYANLFEGNTCDFIYVDNAHGLNGPYNTLVRNNTVGITDGFLSFGGINVSNGAQNVFGNLVRNIAYLVYNPGTLIGFNGTNSSSDNSYNDISYYYNSVPDFLNYPGVYTWPPQGTRISGLLPNVIPASNRWYSGQGSDYYTNSLSERFVPANRITATQFSDVMQHSFGFYSVFENQNYINLGTGESYGTSINPVVKYTQDFRTGTTEKFNRNYDKTSFSNQYINYFSSTPNHNYTGFFDNAVNATLQVSMEGAMNPSGAVLQFIDP